MKPPCDLYDTPTWGWYAGRYTYHWPHISQLDNTYMMTDAAWLQTGYLVQSLDAQTAGKWTRYVWVRAMPVFTADYDKYEVIETLHYNGGTRRFDEVCDRYDPVHKPVVVEYPITEWMEEEKNEQVR